MHVLNVQTRRLVAVAASMALMASVTACGGGHEGHGGSAGSAPSASRASVEVAFLRQMIPHHESAVEMARLIPSRSTHAEVRALGRDIERTQRAEITQMTAMLRERGESATGAEASMDADARTLGLSMASMGMAMHADDLADAKPFDREFLDMMIPHHEGAIRMAERVLAVDPASDVRALAKAIIAAQRREVAQMREWRADWYGATASDDAMDHGEMDHSAMGHGG